jgi:hypothetical protein
MLVNVGRGKHMVDEDDCIAWNLTLPLGNRGVTFLAEKIAGWPFDSEQDAICAAEKFNEVADAIGQNAWAGLTRPH